MLQFDPNTPEQEARALTATCFLAIANGWPTAYIRPSAIATAGNATRLDLDLDRMMSDAADLAAKLTHAAAHRMPAESVGEIILTKPSTGSED